jgi:hypothetical protein
MLPRGRPRNLTTLRNRPLALPRRGKAETSPLRWISGVVQKSETRSCTMSELLGQWFMVRYRLPNLARILD